MNYRTLRGKFHLTAETANYGWPPGRGSAGGGGKWLEICLGYLWQSCHFPGNFWGDVFFVCKQAWLRGRAAGSRNLALRWVSGFVAPTRLESEGYSSAISCRMSRKWRSSSPAPADGKLIDLCRDSTL